MKKNNLRLEDLEKIDFSKLSYEEKIKTEALIKELYNRRLKYPILDFQPQEHQQDVINAVAVRRTKASFKPLYKYILLIGWNWAAKTSTGCYIDILLALWKTWQKYWLPYIWSARQLLIVTKTSDSIRTNLEPYFIWTNSVTDVLKIPDQEIAKIKRDPSTQALKSIKLKNGNEILFRTYDAWQARLEGSNPDFIHLDELPEREDIFIELLRGTRGENSQMLLTFTPTKFNPAVHNYFYWQNSELVKERSYIREVDSLANKYADHTWLEWLSTEEQKIRRYWQFVPPTWLVYKEFNRNQNVIEWIDPKELWPNTRFFWALDFWVNHPLAFLFIAVDEDWHIYVFDIIYEKWLLLSDLNTKVRDILSEYWITLEYIVADTADARARLELKEIWLHTIPADKFSKGENNLSNRRAWIFKINWLLKDWFLIISDRCKALIREFEIHAYKWNWSEEVEKTNDDALDALRYFVFWYTKPSIKKDYRKRIRNKTKVKANRY